MSVSPLRRALQGMREWGLRHSDYAREELFDALVSFGVDLNFAALDRFLQSAEHWSSPEAREKRDEILQLRDYARRAYDAGRIELALMTAARVHCEAQFIGWRVTADPVMRKHDKAVRRGKEAQRVSSERRTQKTAEKMSRYSEVVAMLTAKYGKAPAYRVAEELGITQPTLAAWKKKQCISES